jgi:hypothetical protein
MDVIGWVAPDWRVGCAAAAASKAAPVGRQPTNRKAEPTQRGARMLAGEIRRVKPGRDGERLLHWISPAANLYEMISYLGRFNPADCMADAPLLQREDLASDLHAY